MPTKTRPLARKGRGRAQWTCFSTLANTLSFNHISRSASSFLLPVRARRPLSRAFVIVVYPSQISVMVRRSVEMYKSTSSPGSIEHRSTSGWIPARPKPPADATPNAYGFDDRTQGHSSLRQTVFENLPFAINRGARHDPCGFKLL